MTFSSRAVICCCALQLLIALSYGYSARNVELPTILVVVNPNNNEIVLHKPTNSKLIVGQGEEIALSSRLKLECEAPYPVQFIYSGDGMPEYTTNTSNSDNHKISQDQEFMNKPRILFQAELFLGYGRQLGYYDSGKYTCRSLQNPSRAVHYYIFVNDGKLFVRPEGDTIYFKRSDLAVRIPCSVTHPNAVVSLQKSVNGLVQCPLNESISFEPTSGFQVKISNRFDPAGTYVCTAGYKGVYQATQYILASDEPPPTSTSLPTPSPIRQPCHRDVDCPNNEACLSTGHCESPCSKSCGQNSSCRVVNHLAECKCLPGYGGDPYVSCHLSQSHHPAGADPCHPFPCGQNTICENYRGIAKCSCAEGFQGDPYYRCYRRSDPCNPNPCGQHSNCINRNNYASCSCAQGFVGTPPHCRAECESDHHCSYSQICRHYRCRNPCDGACNDIPNTQCRVINRRPVCARVQNRCPSGYYGRDCSKIYERETVPYPIPQTLVPIAGGAKETEPEPVVSPCVPFPCGANAECLTRTVTNLALNETSDVALCQCPPGKTGNADIECYPVEEQVINDDVRHDLSIASLEDETESSTSANQVDEQTSSVLPSSPPSTTVHPSVESSSPTTTIDASTKAPKKCGSNAIAIVSADGKSHCSCPVGFTGLASIECHELNDEVQQLDDDNESANLVEPEYCTNASITCGANAYCSLINGTETCQCMRPFKGNPDIACELECNSDSDCPSQFTCYEASKRCVDPCEPSLQMFFKQCGRDAFCKVEDHKPVCYCPQDLPHGDPTIHCKEKSWMPNHLPPSPIPTCSTKENNCGLHAECRAFHDQNTYCVCMPGYYGDPYGKDEGGCQLGIQCRNTTQCPTSKECINGRCLDPCRNKQVDCGPHAGCSAEEHKSKCICNIGTIRNPNGMCEPVKGALAERMAFFRSFEDFKRK